MTARPLGSRRVTRVPSCRPPCAAVQRPMWLLMYNAHYHALACRALSGRLAAGPLVSMYEIAVDVCYHGLNVNETEGNRQLCAYGYGHRLSSLFLLVCVRLPMLSLGE